MTSQFVKAVAVQKSQLNANNTFFPRQKFVLLKISFWFFFLKFYFLMHILVPKFKLQLFFLLIPIIFSILLKVVFVFKFTFSFALTFDLTTMKSPKTFLLIFLLNLLQNLPVKANDNEPATEAEMGKEPTLKLAHVVSATMHSKKILNLHLNLFCWKNSSFVMA